MKWVDKLEHGDYQYMQLRTSWAMLRAAAARNGKASESKHAGDPSLLEIVKGLREAALDNRWLDEGWMEVIWEEYGLGHALNWVTFASLKPHLFMNLVDAITLYIEKRKTQHSNLMPNNQRILFKRGLTTGFLPEKIPDANASQYSAFTSMDQLKVTKFCNLVILEFISLRSFWIEETN